MEFSKSVPNQLNYQGYLVDATDSVAVTDTLQMTFRLFDSKTKEAELWSETHPAVEVNNGLFQVLLGSVTPLVSESNSRKVISKVAVIADESAASTRKPW